MNIDAISYPGASDVELLQKIRLQASDAHIAFSELYERYQGQIAKYCCAVVGNSDGYDAFQETFIRFYNLVQRTPIENVHAMLITIARNICLNLKRNRQPISLADDDTIHLNLSVPSVSGEYEKQELMRLIEIGLEYLEFDVREAFVLRHYQELSYQEIASLTGVPETTVTKRIWRAKERLKQVLSPFINDLNHI